MKSQCNKSNSFIAPTNASPMAPFHYQIIYDHKISHSLERKTSKFEVFQSLWNLAGVSATPLPALSAVQSDVHISDTQSRRLGISWDITIRHFSALKRAPATIVADFNHSVVLITLYCYLSSMAGLILLYISNEIINIVSVNWALIINISDTIFGCNRYETWYLIWLWLSGNVVW